MALDAVRWHLRTVYGADPVPVSGRPTPMTSLDGGASYLDITNFECTTASAREVVNLSSLTPVMTALTPSDGALTANTVQDGIIGSR